MDYQNMRGGRIVLQNISSPETNFWGTGLEAMETALELEKSIYKSLHELHTVAETHHDPQFSDFLEGKFIVASSLAWGYTTSTPVAVTHLFLQSSSVCYK